MFFFIKIERKLIFLFFLYTYEYITYCQYFKIETSKLVIYLQVIFCYFRKYSEKSNTAKIVIIMYFYTVIMYVNRHYT